MRRSVTVLAQKNSSPSPLATMWHLVFPGEVCYDHEVGWCESLRIHQCVDAAEVEPAPFQLEDDMELNEFECMGLHCRHLAPLQPIRTMTTSLQCCGAENTRFFSHACRSLWLQHGFQGAGEMWIFSTTEVKAVFIISCCGGEENLYLVNREGKPTLSRHCETKWLVSERNEEAIIISVFATGVCLVLSHANGQLTLQSGYRGEGELWKPAVVGSQ